eukprot:CAMPEP_0119080148 /NCGR_PEP_ID=MMETSP1178-20130426/110800_1 /TAXON_ID=33656 /ORGANISM="unid sp, Strain CCMP2000" /LENGTH=74 /DNA_ID=CAMNT_0007062725 /DNA_START=64 /DNA_END=284 /DNA_ORIENTATION=+
MTSVHFCSPRVVACRSLRSRVAPGAPLRPVLADVRRCSCCCGGGVMLDKRVKAQEAGAVGAGEACGGGPRALRR